MTYAHTLNITTEGALKVNLEEYFAVQDHKEKNIMKMLFPNDPNPPLAAWMVAHEEVLNPEWVEYVKSMLPPEIEMRDFVMVFDREGTPQFNAHVDVTPNDPPVICVFGMNFVLLEEDQTEMVWYKRIDGEEMNPYDLTSYSGLQRDSLEEIGRAKIGKNNLALVNTCEYHDIDNHGGPRRWCVSLRTNMPYKTWEEAVEAFRPLIK